MSDLIKLDKKYTLSGSFKSVKSDKEEDDKVIIEGWANIAFTSSGEYVVDSDDEVVIPAGMDITDFEKNPVMLFAHDRWEVPVGKFTSIEKRAEGLWVKGEVYKAVNSEVYSAVKHGLLQTFSIGFRALEGRWSDDNYDVFLITKSVLKEISIVPIPANQESLFSVVKGCDGNCYLSAKNFIEKETVNMDKELIKTVEALKTEIANIKELLASKKEDTPSNDVQSKNDDATPAQEKVSLKEISESVAVSEDNLNEIYDVAQSLLSKCNMFVNNNLK